MFRKLYNWTLHWAGSRYAEPAMGAVSFVESSVFPIPADVLFVPMCLARPDRVWRYALIATITSVLGGIFGWMIGHYAFDLLARPALEFYGKLGAFEALKAQTGDTAILVMLITSGLSHLPPMKVVTILSGVVSFDLKWFILSAIVARGGRFYLLAYLLQRYGAQVTGFIERRLALIVGGLVVVGGLIWLATRMM
ncbi:YqaA family protein [Cypionkella sp.]|jgi:membrane protein YqaA with SNARE-associated domain|uniref:YqaA family protein n=1 Tax=Cypionkella sp. TaxID=2811411 RepID=UPI00271AAA31|nr:YqaA family protein [Cypionkella sp.]MDO8983954.1 YqaA family protein [Cypionkella sp.]MDP1577472.1 YqaA family protein [Cypionkella sp.]MDP2049477.1 YqaA family protein [Cypionkella sp.]